MEFEDKMVEMKDIVEFFGVARRTIYEWIKHANFPKPAKIGHKNFWKKSEIEAFIESKRK